MVERFADHWNVIARAHAARVVFHFIPDPQARALALRAGQLDLVADGSPALAEELERAGLHVMRSEVGACDALSVNIHGAAPYTIGGDPSARTAIGLALDRKAIVAAAWRNSADASHTWIPPRVLGLSTFVLGLSAVWWVRYARLSRAFVLRGRELPSVEAARALGASHLRILIRELIPQAVATVIVVATLDAGTLILAVAGLSFLGLGAQPPTPEWGTMINEGRNLLFTSPHVMLFPGAAVTITVVGVNLVGEALYEAVGVDAVRTPWL